MPSRLSSSAAAFCLGAVMVFTTGLLVPGPPAVPQDDSAVWEVAVILTRMEAECSPDSVMNDYVWSATAPPTERHRREMLARLHELRDTALEEVRHRLRQPREDEFGEMLVVIAAGLGDNRLVLPAARLMAYSGHPAVRLSAARELRALRDPRTVEWFMYAAENDDRRVHNDACGRTVEFFYPVRSVAQTALGDMGIAFMPEAELRQANR